MPKIDFIVNRIFNSITYILPTGVDEECWLVDCGDIEKVICAGWNVKGVLLTHAHCDHIYGLNRLLEVFLSAKIYTNEAGLEGLLNPKVNFSRYHQDVDDFVLSKPENVVLVKEGSTICLSDEMTYGVIETPGHEPSCVCYMNDECIFTGDAHIPGIKVVTSFPRSNKTQAIVAENRIKELAKGKKIYAGHKIY